jgi:fucose permease
MFLMHAVYGLGATVSPFVSTAFVQHEPTHVYYYFAVSLALAILTATVLAVVFRGRTEDQVVGKRLPDGDGETSAEVHGGVPMTTTSTSVGVESGVVTPVEKEARQQHQQRLPDEAREKLEGSGNKMKRIMRTPAIHFMAFYIMIYVSG